MNFSDIKLIPKKCIVSSRQECDIKVKIGNKEYAAPVIPANMESFLTRDICKIFDNRGWLYVYYRTKGTKDVEDFVRTAQNWNTVSISVGIQKEWVYLVTWLGMLNLKVDVFTVDIAYSFTDSIIPIVECIRKHYPDATLIVGNGNTPEWIKFLEDLDIKYCKMNVGVSSACRTYEYTGFGTNTLSDLYACAEAAKSIEIISDGGITRLSDGDIAIGDVAKAIRFGAIASISGALFSRCVDSPAIVSGYSGNAAFATKGSKHVEGATVSVQTNGLTVNQMIDRIEDSIRSSVSYAGGTDLSALKTVDWKYCYDKLETRQRFFNAHY